jgi:starch phosphorylase
LNLPNSPQDNTKADPAQVAELKKTIEIKLLYIVGKDPAHASIHDWYIATALAARDRVVDHWVDTTRRT